MKTKKEHYVPQCYLEAWTSPPSKQVYVFDKRRDSFRMNNIEDVASQRYFYDTDPINLLSEEMILALMKANKSIREDADQQLIEHMLSIEVENFFKDYLKRIADAAAASPWTLKNCYFLSEYEKKLFSELLSIQYLRTKSIRNRLAESSDCLARVLKDMNFPDEAIDKWKMPESSVKVSHLKLLTSRKSLEEVAISFFSLTWLLLINKTSTKLYSCDSPIITLAHTGDALFPGTGLRSRGVEVYFPISPVCGLVMLDGEFHNMTMLDRRFVPCEDASVIQGYNTDQVIQSEECVFSQDGNWGVAEKIRKETPELLNQPRTALLWGGKKYYPDK